MKKKDTKKRDLTTDNHQSSIINHQSNRLLSEEKLDFLSEMMNIGAGNAVVAFSQMIQCEVNVEIPKLEILEGSKISSVSDDPSLPVVCVRMGLVGDIRGDIFFIVPEEEKNELSHLAEKAMQKPSQLTPDLSALAEIGNIISGAYLTAIHDFCQLNIYHSVPTVAIDMIQSVIDESIVTHSREFEEIILIENKFVVEKSVISTFLLLIPSIQSMKILANSIGQAIKGMREER